MSQTRGTKLTKKRQQSIDTQERLIRVATEMFAERGYAGTATEDLVARTGLTRGALYHQYADKRDLFRAVFESVERQLAEKMMLAAAAAAASTAEEQMRIGTRAFLEACLEPAVRRIVLIDGPSVLGWEEWRRIDSQYAFGLVRAVWEGSMRVGTVPAMPLEPLTHLMLGSLNEAGLAVAAAVDPHSAIEEFVMVIDTILRGLALAAQSSEAAAPAAPRRARPRRSSKEP